ncbi:MAG: glycoside hydrolase family 99-like domain-containing protein, partial [Bacteroidota bacterium]
DRNHIRHLLPYFKDPRYIRINNKPVFVIYKSYLFPDIKNTINIWRQEAKKENIDLYLIKFEHYSLNYSNPNEEGFDASAEFQPWSPFFEHFLKNNFQKKREQKLSYQVKKLFYRVLKNRDALRKMRYYKSWQAEYGDYIDFLIKNYSFPETYLRYPSVVPSWDNTARRGQDGSYFLNSNPVKFKEWLSFITNKFNPPDNEQNLIFINAWNEWAEGNHLEPCSKWGKSYLEALRIDE